MTPRLQPLPGFRDVFPDEFARRRKICDAWRTVALRYGFEEYDGPPLEALDLYTAKSGEEIVGQLYSFVDKGMASRSSPFASYALDGITTLIPGDWTNWASTASEWNSGLLIPPPKGARMVTWQWYRPRERMRNLASCGPIWWKACAVKPRN